MQLIHIKDTVCPCCGSRTVTESQRSQHTNGQWFESREFQCGSVLRWVPNFNRLEIERICPQSIEAREIDAARTSLKKAIEALIKESRADDDYKQRLLRWM